MCGDHIIAVQYVMEQNPRFLTRCLGFGILFGRILGDFWRIWGGDFWRGFRMLLIRCWRFFDWFLMDFQRFVFVGCVFVGCFRLNILS